MNLMPSIKTISVMLVILFLMPAYAVAGSGAAQDLGITFDTPDGMVFSQYPSVPGGRFIPVSRLESRYYYAVMRLEVFRDQWPELVTEQFIKKYSKKTQ